MVETRTRASMAEQADALHRLLVREERTHDAAWQAEVVAHELRNGSDSEAARRAKQLVKELGRRAPRHVHTGRALQEGIEALRLAEPEGPSGEVRARSVPLSEIMAHPTQSLLPRDYLDGES